jgi:hypothetical protein
MNKPPDHEKFLTQYPLGQWLDDIVDVLLKRPRGTAHVSDIAHDVACLPMRRVEKIDQTITRTINNYCEDAADFKGSISESLFRRVSPATYKLKDFPNRPVLAQSRQIRFHDEAMNETFKFVSDLIYKKYGRIDSDEVIIKFINSFYKNDVIADFYEDRRKSIESMRSIFLNLDKS